MRGHGAANWNRNSPWQVRPSQGSASESRSMASNFVITLDKAISRASKIRKPPAARGSPIRAFRCQQGTKSFKTSKDSTARSQIKLFVGSGLV
jgi:hypothetical protein